MAQINITIPEPGEQYSSENQRQVLETFDTLKNQLNTSYQEDLKEQTRYIYLFNIMTIKYKSETFNLATTNITLVSAVSCRCNYYY